MTKNEADNIGPCLDALADFDQVFVVDSASSDATCDIARDHGAEIVEFTWNGGYPKKKQWCLDHLPFKHRHVLYLDADERMRPELAREISSAVTRDDRSGWFVGLDYVWMGRVLRHGAVVYKLVLFDRHRGRFLEWDDLDATRMWEVEGHYQPTIDGPTAILSSRLLHDDHDQLYDWFERHNKYSDWEAVVRVNGTARSGGETQTGPRHFIKQCSCDSRKATPLVCLLGARSAERGVTAAKEFSSRLAKAMYQWQIDVKSDEIRRRGTLSLKDETLESQREKAIGRRFETTPAPHHDHVLTCDHAVRLVREGTSTTAGAPPGFS